MQVSSRHLILASRVFKAMLSGGFQEGALLESTGKAEIPLEDTDSVAFEILLDIIHGRHKRVPRNVDFDCLVEIATLTDMYELHESVELAITGWLDYAHSTGSRYLSSLKGKMQWLWICHVFKVPKRSSGYLGQVILDTTSSEQLSMLAESVPMPDYITGESPMLHQSYTSHSFYNRWN